MTRWTFPTATPSSAKKVDDEIPTEETETIGDAVLTQAQVGEYVAVAKMEREQTHSNTRDS